MRGLWNSHWKVVFESPRYRCAFLILSRAFRNRWSRIGKFYLPAALNFSRLVGFFGELREDYVLSLPCAERKRTGADIE
jgi:hypothetical protein